MDMKNDVNENRSDADYGGSDHPDFIREKIITKKNIRSEIINYLCKPAAGGLVFGLTAAVVFAVFSSVFVPQNEKTAKLPEETEAETAEEDVHSELPQNQKELEAFISQQIDKKTQEKKQTLSETVQSVADSLERSLVLVEAVRKDMDWFSTSYDSEMTQSGIIIRNTDDQYYILTGCSGILDADSIRCRFPNGEWVESRLQGYDTAYNAAVLAVEKKSVVHPEQIQVILMGSTASLKPGAPVMAAGSPSGRIGSVNVGFISCIDEQISLTDTTIRGIQSSIPVSASGCSFLIGMDGNLLGIYTDHSQTGESLINNSGYSTAYSIEDMYPAISRIYEGKTTAGLGILGQDMDEEIRSLAEIPEGIYILDVMKDSPAYTGGLQEGDILYRLDGESILTMEDYEKKLTKLLPDRPVSISVYRYSKGAYIKMELRITPAVRQD